MIVIKRAFWQLMVASFTLLLHVILVLVCLAAFIVSPLAQVVYSVRQTRSTRISGSKEGL